jgi:molybdopterin molybdotransferase
LPDGNGVPIILLPGEPFACLVAYDMLAARFVRRLAGADPTPYSVAEFELSRKIVSGIGSVEIVPVRLTGNQAQPVGADAGLAGTLQADGFVVVPATSEGYGPGARVRVHLYDRHQAQAPQDMVS